MKKLIYLSIIMISFILVNCKKDVEQNISVVNVTKTSDINVPKNFNWQNTQNIQVSVSVPATSGNLLDVISIYDGNPNAEAQLLASGSARNGNPYAIMLNIPTYLKKVWVVRKGADGSTDVQTMNTNVPAATVTFAHSQGKTVSAYQINAGPGTSADFIITQTTGTITVTGGNTYIINSAFTGTIAFEHWHNGGTLKVNNNCTLTIPTMGDKCHIEVLPNAKATLVSATNMFGSSSFTVYSNGEALINNITISSTNTAFTSWGTTTITSWGGTVVGPVTNYAYFHALANTTTAYNTPIENSGDMIFENDFQANGNVTNWKTFHVKGSYTQNNGNNQSDKLWNHCKVVVDNNMYLNNIQVKTEPDGGASFVVGGLFKGNTGTQVDLKDASLLLTNTMEFYGSLNGSGLNTSSVKVTGSFVNMWGTTVKSKLELSGVSATTPAGVTYQGSNAVYHSIATATNVIPSSDCSPGNGVQPIVADNDGDGVPDSQDAYPNDPTKAFNNYAPGANTFGTIMFEDLWPSAGDYDLNDLITNYKINVVTNAQNKAVEIDATLKIKAIGASLNSGFGLRFDNLTPNQIQSVTGTHIDGSASLNINSNGTEANQDKAVVVLFDKAFSLVPALNHQYMNTVLAYPTVQAPVMNIVIKFAQPIVTSTLGAAPYNFFIFRTENRGLEVHAIDAKPTSLANPSYFGTLSDKSIPSANKYYCTANGLPWAIYVPAEIDWATEKTDIVTAFNYFATWAQSGGVMYPDWYLDLSNYRVNSKIYHYNLPNK